MYVQVQNFELCFINFHSKAEAGGLGPAQEFPKPKPRLSGQARGRRQDF